MLRRLYNKTIELAEHPKAIYALIAVAFAESSFFPIPPDPMLVPMVLARPQSAWRIAFLTTIASVLGGIAGYAIGYFLYETIGQWVIHFYGYQENFHHFQQKYDEWGFWIIMIKGLTPIPYKLVTIASGVAKFDLTIFIVASIITRGARFYLVCALLKYYGQPIRIFIEKYLTWVTTAFLVLIISGLLLIKYV
ncbi:MAG: DedA family protein [Alphaproteobacteria bacterium]|nr:DedA family protein [Alphaproteobacteria bacterium]